MLGTYEGRRKVDIRPDADPSIGYTLGLVRLEVQDNGRAALQDRGMNRKGVMDYEDGRAIFVTETISGMKIERQPDDIKKTARISMVPRKNGTWLYDGEIELTKKPDKSN